MYRDNGTAVVDFSSKNLSGSETVEKMLISQIVNTLIKSLTKYRRFLLRWTAMRLKR